MYDNIVDEVVFVARASEGAMESSWLMDQPISIRKKYVERLQKELQERKEKLQRKK